MNPTDFITTYLINCRDAACEELERQAANNFPLFRNLNSRVAATFLGFFDQLNQQERGDFLSQLRDRVETPMTAGSKVGPLVSKYIIRLHRNGAFTPADAGVLNSRWKSFGERLKEEFVTVRKEDSNCFVVGNDEKFSKLRLEFNLDTNFAWIQSQMIYQKAEGVMFFPFSLFEKMGLGPTEIDIGPEYDLDMSIRQIFQLGKFQFELFSKEFFKLSED